MMIDQGIACYCYGESTCGQRVFYQFGLTKVPIYNVNNNCSTGSTGLALARTMVSNGAANCVLPVAFEKMSPGCLQNCFNDWESPLARLSEMNADTTGITNAPRAAEIFGEYIEKRVFDDLHSVSLYSPQPLSDYKATSRGPRESERGFMLRAIVSTRASYGTSSWVRAEGVNKWDNCTP